MASALHERQSPPVKTGKLRVRITRQLFDSIDGIQLDCFRRGCVYEVSTLLASYLLAIGAAEPADEDAVVSVLPPHQQMFGPQPRGHSYTLRQAPAQAADLSSEKRRRKRGPPDE